MKASDRDMLLIRLDENMKGLHAKVDKVGEGLETVVDKHNVLDIKHGETRNTVKFVKLAVFGLYGLAGSALLAAYFR